MQGKPFFLQIEGIIRANQRPCGTRQENFGKLYWEWRAKVASALHGY
jgi:hypothetical protein